MCHVKGVTCLTGSCRPNGGGRSERTCLAGLAERKAYMILPGVVAVY